MTAQPTLFGAPTGNCFRAAIALEEANLPYRVALVDLRHGEQLGDAFLALNPMGKVPVLVGAGDGATAALTQSNAIVFYADQKTPGALAPAFDDPARAIVMERYFYLVTDVIALSQLSFRLSMAGFADAAALMGRRAVAALAHADDFLADGPWLAGQHFSMVDIAAYTLCVSFLDDLDWKTLPRLRAWFQRTAARPAIVRGMQAFSGNTGN